MRYRLCVRAGLLTGLALLMGGVGCSQDAVVVDPLVNLGGTADPTLLPVASGQVKDPSFSYGRNLQAGESYVDPVTGVTVIKLSDATTPMGNEWASVHQGQVTSVSMPWGANGEMRTVSVGIRTNFTSVWLADVNIQTGQVSNWRNVGSQWGSSDAMSAIAFSPRDPRTVYVGSTDQIRKWDTSTDTFVSDGTFPKTIPGLGRGSILFVSADEKVFVVTQYNRQWWKYWHVDTDQVIAPASAVNGQGSVNPSGAWGAGADNDNLSNYMYKINTTTGARSDPPFGRFRVSHPAHIVGNYVIGGDPTRSGGAQLHFWDLDADTKIELGTPGSITPGSRHFAGNWVVGQPDPPWALVSTFVPRGLIRDAVGFVRLDGGNPDPRLLCHTDSYSDDWAGDFRAQPHAASSPDGKVVIFSSRSGGGPRIDVFMALVPSR